MDTFKRYAGALLFAAALSAIAPVCVRKVAPPTAETAGGADGDIRAGERGSFSLTLTAGSGGALSASPRKDSYAAGEKVTLTAVPDSVHVFAGWTGGHAADSISPVTTITVLSDTTVAAKFRRIEYGSFTDERDGKTYRTVKIGRRTWMAENLNYKPADGESSCLDDKTGNCRKYGRLYDWSTALEACPAGWQLSSFDDWDALVNYAGGPDVAGRKLKAASGLVGNGRYRDKGTDDYGFSALPGGGEPVRWFENDNIFGSWWTVTELYGGAVCVRLTLHQDKFGGIATDRSDMYSVRCVMDEDGILVLNAFEGGTVSGNPRKTAFKVGETVTITATPKSGYEFAYWRGWAGNTIPGAAVMTVTMRSDMHIIAVFRATPGPAGTFADKRDGQKYRTTQIGNRVWMAQNLNYKTGNSWCYNDSNSYCKKYGRLYDWSTANTACPAGWHLPSRAEWDAFGWAAGGKLMFKGDQKNDWSGVGRTLKAKKGWDDEYTDGNGTDYYGFSALPGGKRDDTNDDDFDEDSRFSHAGDAGIWWTATDGDDEEEANTRSIQDNSDELFDDVFNKNYGLSVRCVMDGGNKQASAQKAKRAAGKDGAPEIEMVFVKGGTFMMGASDADTKSVSYVDRAHEVTLGDFHIGKYEVTQKQWTQVMGGNPSGGAVGDDYPVNNVSWNDIDEFIERLNAATGKKYRLPTEAEWEYAARGGANSKGYGYSGSDNPDDVAWYAENSGGGAHPVGTKAPNELGLYDMTGNVWELLSDYMADYNFADRIDPKGPDEGTVRASRGYSWARNACRVFDRGYSPLGESGYDTGFRLALLP